MRTTSPKFTIAAALVLIGLYALSACMPEQTQTVTSTPPIETTDAPLRAPAPVESIDIFQNDSFPVEVSVVARGHFPNECSSIDQVQQERRGSTFAIVIDSVHQGATNCPESPVAFEESLTLDLADLPAGIYVVDVNGLQGTFKLQRDNIRDDGNAVLGGLVWHDRCDLLPADDGDEQAPSAGCVDQGDGLYIGDGVRAADETGIGGLMVNLGAGICPSTGLATTLTDSAGAFLFSGLMAGDYCLTVLGDQTQTGSLGGEGIWTFPSDGVGQQTIALRPGDSQLDVSFGWSPAQEPDEPVFFATPKGECTNKAFFVADVTIPDDTPVLPGEIFTKTWELQNLGSCTWDPTYSLVLFAGEEMSATNGVPLTVTVPPGEHGELSVRLVAPDEPGAYRGEWKLVDPEGSLFGIGPGSDRPFWVQIVVVEEEAAG